MYGNATEINVVIRNTKFDMLSKISPVARICPFRDCADGISTYTQFRKGTHCDIQDNKRQTIQSAAVLLEAPLIILIRMRH